MANNNDNGIDDWEEVAPVQAAADDGVDDWEEVSDVETVDAAPNTSIQPELSIPELSKTLGGGVIGGATGLAAGTVAKKGAESLLDPQAERLAYRAAGGMSGPKVAKQLNKNEIFDRAGQTAKSIEELATTGVFDRGVSPRSVGREILDENVLGKLGLFTTKAGNLERASENLNKKAIPTNAILDQVSEYPIQQEGILERMKSILGYDDLKTSTNDDDISVRNKLDSDIADESKYRSVETPLKAEQEKRKLSKKANWADVDGTAKNAMNTAQATARKEAVENAVLNSLGPEKLEEFKRLKAKSGSAAVTKQLLEQAYDSSQKPFSQFNGILGAGIDYVKQRGSGVAANVLDTASKGIKKASPGLGLGLGTLLGATVGASAADDNTTASDFIPGLDQAESAGSAIDDKLMQGEVKARQNYDASPAARDAKSKMEQDLGTFNELKQPKAPDFSARNQVLENGINNVDDSFKNGFAYKQAQQELERNKASTAPKKAQQQLAEGSKNLSQATPDQLMELSQSFQSTPGAQSFVAPLENAAQASSESEMKARLFGLYQQPAFRQLLKKGNPTEG